MTFNSISSDLNNVRAAHLEKLLFPHGIVLMHLPKVLAHLELSKIKERAGIFFYGLAPGHLNLSINLPGIFRPVQSALLDT